MATKDVTTKDFNLIGEGTTIEGKVKSQGSVRVDGRIVGELIAHETVVVGAAGEIEGNVAAKNITVGGKVKGSLAAQEKLFFQTQAVVRGDINAAKLVVDEGAVFDGKCSMTSDRARMVRPEDGTPRPALGVVEQKR